MGHQASAAKRILLGPLDGLTSPAPFSADVPMPGHILHQDAAGGTPVGEQNFKPRGGREREKERKRKIKRNRKRQRERERERERQRETKRHRGRERES